MTIAPPSALSRLRADRRAWFGTAVVMMFVLVAVAAPLFATFDPSSIDLRHALERPSTLHWFGTDAQGRDVWSRLLYGTRVSLLVGLASQGLSLLIGVVLGLIAGYRGRWTDEIIMRLADVTLAFPSLLLLIAMAAAFEPSLTVVCIVIGVVGWAGMARLVRGQVLVVRELEYVQAMR
ncbi:MAG: ABC transporter permease, partial [Gemmatimonas sp.]